MTIVAAKQLPTVAVIGAGPLGVSMLKTLREDGFPVTLFERRDQVGGIWNYTTNKEFTSAQRVTRANLSKFTCGYTDYPIPDKYPDYLTQGDFQDFMKGYATHFDLYRDIIFNATVRNVERNKDDTKWVINFATNDKTEQASEFDKVVFCHGYQTKKIMPTFPGQHKYTGSLIHAQQYSRPQDYKGQRVVVLGFGCTGGDIAPLLTHYASKVYVSHRRGNLLGFRYRGGKPADMLVTWRKRVIGWWMQEHMPAFTRWAASVAVPRFSKPPPGVKVDPAWRLDSFPNVTLKLPGGVDEYMPGLLDGSLTSVHGIKAFVGEKAIELDDGTILEDIDAVICATGYTADFSVAPFVETSLPSEPRYDGPELPRLYMNLFPPRYSDSCALLCYSAYGKNNGFSFSDVQSMAISSLWRGLDSLPSRSEQEKWIDEHQNWIAERRLLEPTAELSAVKQYEFQQWLHRIAGTGMENLGWGLAGWKFWWKDRKMYNLMANGLETAHMFRFFETGKRKTWPGARDEIIRQNELADMRFPLKDAEEVMKQWVVEQKELAAQGDDGVVWEDRL